MPVDREVLELVGVEYNQHPHGVDDDHPPEHIHGGPPQGVAHLAKKAAHIKPHDHKLRKYLSLNLDSKYLKFYIQHYYNINLNI